MRLSDILPPEVELPAGAGGIEITGLTSASGAVTPGALFAALPGVKADGARFIRAVSEALQNFKEQDVKI